MVRAPVVEPKVAAALPNCRMPALIVVPPLYALAAASTMVPVPVFTKAAAAPVPATFASGIETYRPPGPATLKVVLGPKVMVLVAFPPMLMIAEGAVPLTVTVELPLPLRFTIP